MSIGDMPLARLVGGESRRFERSEEFVSLTEPGFVKAAINVRFEPERSGHAAALVSAAIGS